MADPVTSAQDESGLPSGWEVRHSNSKNLPYYFNAAEKISRASQGGAQKPADKIRAAHLLVKHRDSRRPASWRESEITRTKDEARSIIQGHEARIKRGEISLGELAMSESDCSSARKRGDLGYFGKGDMQKPFEEAAFALQPGQMSEVIETDSGLHLIERIE
ncbi:putative parvulin (peptidylprolyl isomerase) [Apiospora saccharicola]